MGNGCFSQFVGFLMWVCKFELCCDSDLAEIGVSISFLVVCLNFGVLISIR